MGRAVRRVFRSVSHVFRKPFRLLKKSIFGTAGEKIAKLQEEQLKAQQTASAQELERMKAEDLRRKKQAQAEAKRGTMGSGSVFDLFDF